MGPARHDDGCQCPECVSDDDVEATEAERVEGELRAAAQYAADHSPAVLG